MLREAIHKNHVAPWVHRNTNSGGAPHFIWKEYQVVKVVVLGFWRFLVISSDF